MANEEEMKSGGIPTGLGDHDPVVVKYRFDGNGEEPKVLMYFCLRGLGELARFLLHASKTNFDDVMYFNSRSGWKEKAAFGQLPIYSAPELEGGASICQSAAIVRFIARTCGLYGKDACEAAKIDMLFEVSKDLDKNKSGVHDSSSAEAGKIEQFLEAIESMAPAKDGFWVGEQMSLGDCSLFLSLNTFVEVGEEFEEKYLTRYPKLNAWRGTFAARPEIASYLSNKNRVPLTQNCIGNKPWARTGYVYTKSLPKSLIANPYST